MGYEVAKVLIEGLTPTIMHNGQLADPTNQWTRAIKVITDKKNKKTDADFDELVRLEWYGSFYIDEESRPVWPGENIEALVRSGARSQSKGKEIEKGLMCVGNWPLIYPGPKTVDELWELDPKFRLTKTAKVGQSKIMRSRPIWPEWKLAFDLEYNTDYFSLDQLRHWIEVAGTDIGLSDWRPKHGRFKVLEFSA